MTDRVERFDLGASIEISLKRGTGTRDQDSVKIKDKAESLEDLEDSRSDLVEMAEETMDKVRNIQPDVEQG